MEEVLQPIGPLITMPAAHQQTKLLCEGGMSPSQEVFKQRQEASWVKNV
jgi:hypothetical protein